MELNYRKQGNNIISEKDVLAANLVFYNLLGTQSLVKSPSPEILRLMALKNFVYWKVFERCICLMSSEIDTSKSLSFLSAGCGADPWVIWLSKYLHVNVIGVDISVNMLRLCQRKIRKANVYGVLVAADVLHLPFRDKSFDVSTTIQSLHHFPDTKNAIKEIARVAGMIITYEPNEQSIFHRIMDHWVRTKKLVEFHSGGFSCKKMTQLLKNAGKNTMSATPFGLIPTSGSTATLLSHHFLLVHFLSKVEDLFQKIPFIRWQLSDLLVLSTR